ncbi:MAG: hypothetical protein A3I44_03550 [Candidatus Sungbacteria bacterium RIFCSPLOWO2_02_FULL_51_17]|uniref:Methyltransferase type 12 n=1 Tax=Candidatus Sungbacteria bacterium RIFCSPHIGHO2_02_FULL_51_29 TaxID=1802273 RepID=A0A1G2KRP1_9BACT|nr:MAG: hypothetical protein A2676_03330 [Candidatus Sungbacteria bacterium RIFCSPHIGHO2_01_FULL_51_22]OHA02108.1 MAG: hypothetical protein A3C16_04830 [Candidatus Sungbacteria bacterium RIFCSPHIGHO2_02_FULL_51_29]OHA06146.1 MAG: hypothetical protein A3B29_01760 [Candidatus Sungbacteria bacterium RIFCSPLOWO2_01_FULL_51_34]OHA10464.1 MAG: hypothetical protein A3I44_03550 [Candidatus Sungbacteria bacterium RIFCSPLOWO2_02_FULL_51_17]
MALQRQFSPQELFQEGRRETWERDGVSFPVDIRCGKTTDLFGLKKDLLHGFKDRVKAYRDMCNRYLSEDSNLSAVEACPLCGKATSEATNAGTIHGMLYVRCAGCDMRYLAIRLSNAALDEFYAKDEVLSATHADPTLTKKRVEEVVMPKVKWAIEAFEKAYGRKPKKIVDVGAGGGQFVYAARLLGLEADGVEPNEPSRNYCKEAFGIDLIPDDFLDFAKKAKGYDMVTAWAVLEHIPNFMEILAAARTMLPSEGMMVAEVPRWHSLDTAIQTRYADAVNRHLFPLSHIQIFSDNALAEAFCRNDLLPSAAWYFGMDTYELTMQLSRLTDDEKIITGTGKDLLGFQQTLDQGMLSDTMVFAGAVRKADA